MKTRNMKTLIVGLAAILITCCQAMSQEGLTKDEREKVIAYAKKASEEYYTGKGLIEFIVKLDTKSKRDKVARKINNSSMASSYSWGTFDSSYVFQFKELINNNMGERSLCHVFSEWNNHFQYMTIGFDKPEGKMILIDYAISLSNNHFGSENYEKVKSQLKAQLDAYEAKYKSQQGK